jgi:hypothetical protein
MRFDPKSDEFADLFSDLEEFRKESGLKGGRFAKLVGEEVVECSLEEWAELMNDRRCRIVDQETVGDRYWVSTVFLGLNHGWLGLDARGVWFETMIFDEYSKDEQHGYRENIYCERYSTMEEARRGHLVGVDHARKLLSTPE